MNTRKRPICSIENCGRDHTAKGLCDFHYRRQRRNVSLDSYKRPINISGQICFVEECSSPVYCANYCSKHYSRFKRWSDVNKSKRFFWKSLAAKCLWHGAYKRAEKEGLDFNIPKEWVEIPDKCPVLGIPIERGVKRFCNNSPTIDRINPSKGYVLGNVHVISYRANRIKNDATPEELMKVATYFREIHERI